MSSVTEHMPYGKHIVDAITFMPQFKIEQPWNTKKKKEKTQVWQLQKANNDQWFFPELRWTDRKVR